MEAYYTSIRLRLEVAYGPPSVSRSGSGLPTVNELSLLPAPQVGLWNNLAFWRIWSLLASGLLLILGLHLGEGAGLFTPLDTIVLINDSVERPAWLLRADGDRQ